MGEVLHHYPIWAPPITACCAAPSWPLPLWEVFALQHPLLAVARISSTDLPCRQRALILVLITSPQAQASHSRDPTQAGENSKFVSTTLFRPTPSPCCPCRLVAPIEQHQANRRSCHSLIKYRGLVHISTRLAPFAVRLYIAILVRSLALCFPSAP